MLLKMLSLKCAVYSACLIGVCVLCLQGVVVHAQLSSWPSLEGGCVYFPSSSNVSSKQLLSLPGIQDAFEQVDLAIQQVLLAEGTPGASVGVVFGQDLIWHSGYGYANASSNKSKVTLDTVFRIGSISKVFTTLLLMLSRDRGMLHLDDQVSEHVPEFWLQNPFPSARNITFRQVSRVSL